jgi:hypothetical protein
MLHELETWWQNTTPEMQEATRQGSLVLAMLLGGHLLGGLVARALRARNFDAALRMPGYQAAGPEMGHRLTASAVAGFLVRLTVWAAAAFWLAQRYDKPELANTLGLIINRTWALATILVTALGLASFLAQRVIDCLQAPHKTGSETYRNGSPGSHGGLGGGGLGAVGAAVYGLVVLLALLVAADLFDWPLTRSSALALWQLSQHLLTAGSALFIGFLGARWARDLVTPESAASAGQRVAQYTALAIVAATTMLAVAVLLTNTSLLFGLAALVVLGLAIWLVRGHLPDVSAGLLLRGHKICEVWLDGESWEVALVGLLSTELTRAGQFRGVQNRQVFEACVHPVSSQAGRR